MSAPLQLASDAAPSFQEGASRLRCLPSRLGHSLRAALRRAGPVGRRLRPGGLLAVAALHLHPGLLSHLLVRLHPAGAAVPGEARWLQQER